MLAASWCLALQEHLERCSSRLQDPSTPSQEDICALEKQLLDIVESLVSKLGEREVKTSILQQVLGSWTVIVQLIRRRIFQDDFSGAALIKITEIDCGYNDALFSLSISALVPAIDFELTAALGYFFYNYFSLHVGNSFLKYTQTSRVILMTSWTGSKSA